MKTAGDLVIPEGASLLVIFVHGSGSSRLSPRNRQVATFLNEAGIATLLIDLLTEEEDVTYETRFDIPLLTERVIEIIQEMRKHSLPIALFGASTGAAAALRAAAREEIVSVVSRGGRPDLALDSLAQVKAPTLLIVGECDPVVIGMNEKALAQLNCEKQLAIVKGATHLFEEKGCLEEVCRLARAWFLGRSFSKSL